MPTTTSLRVSSCTVFDFIKTGERNKFVIPDYQRPYSWEEEQVETLFNDIWNFTIENIGRKDSSYFLGSIVSFVNTDGENEIIDGQQRITTLFLLLRAIYKKLETSETNTENSKAICENLTKKIGSIIFQTDPKTGKVHLEVPLLETKVLGPSRSSPLSKILETGEVGVKSSDRYSRNYCFIQKLLDDKFSRSPDHFFDFVLGIVDHTIVLPITAESMDTALIIFQTLNDRGLPLSDADIFKATIYKYKNRNERKNFISEWTDLNKEAEDNQESIQKLFYYYMFYLRAIDGDYDSTTPGLRKYYLEKGKKRLMQPDLLEKISRCLNLWKVVNSKQFVSNERWSKSKGVLVTLDILSSYPNEFWKYPVVVYYLKHHRAKYFEQKFELFLKKLTSTLIAQYSVSPSVNSVKRPILKLNAEIFKSNHPSFESFGKVEVNKESIILPHPKIERMLLKLLAYSVRSQPLLQRWEIEHILPKKWDDHFFSDDYSPAYINETIEHIGNKIPLEKKLNIKASNGYFSKKKQEYRQSKIKIAQELSIYRVKDWNIPDITARDMKIYEKINKIISQWEKDYDKGLRARKSLSTTRRI